MVRHYVCKGDPPHHQTRAQPLDPPGCMVCGAELVETGKNPAEYIGGPPPTPKGLR